MRAFRIIVATTVVIVAVGLAMYTASEDPVTYMAIPDTNDTLVKAYISDIIKEDKVRGKAWVVLRIQVPGASYVAQGDIDLDDCSDLSAIVRVRDLGDSVTIFYDRTYTFGSVEK